METQERVNKTAHHQHLLATVPLRRITRIKVGIQGTSEEVGEDQEEGATTTEVVVPAATIEVDINSSNSRSPVVPVEAAFKMVDIPTKQWACKGIITSTVEVVAAVVAVVRWEVCAEE